jgi:hypothetical protein
MEQYNYLKLAFSGEQHAVVDELTSQEIATILNLEEGVQCVQDIFDEYQKEDLAKDPRVYANLLDMLHEIFDWYLTQEPPFRIENIEDDETVEEKMFRCCFWQEELEGLLEYKIIWFSQKTQEPFVFNTKEYEGSEDFSELIIFVDEDNSEVLDQNYETAVERIQDIAQQEDWTPKTLAKVLKQYEMYANDVGRNSTKAEQNTPDFRQN